MKRTRTKAELASIHYHLNWEEEEGGRWDCCSGDCLWCWYGDADTEFDYNYAEWLEQKKQTLINEWLSSVKITFK